MADFLTDLEHHRVKKAPPSLYYIPEFISHEEEKLLMSKVYSAPKPKWTQLSKRRLQNWGGLPHPKGMITEDIPQWLLTHCKAIGSLGAFEGKVPNHVLVNEYLPGQGIMPHEDGPLFYPTVSTITLGSHAVLNFYHHLKDLPGDGQQQESPSFKDRHFQSVLLEPRSLILVREEMYTKYLHGIDEITTDTITENIANLDQCTLGQCGDTLTRDTRISLTIRVVPKILKSKVFFGKK